MKAKKLIEQVMNGADPRTLVETQGKTSDQMMHDFMTKIKVSSGNSKPFGPKVPNIDNPKQHVIAYVATSSSAEPPDDAAQLVITTDMSAKGRNGLLKSMTTEVHTWAKSQGYGVIDRRAKTKADLSKPHVRVQLEGVFQGGYSHVEIDFFGSDVI